MVREAEVLIACPAGREPKHGSGTWFTIRYAQKRGVPVMFVWPDGEVSMNESAANAAPYQPIDCLLHDRIEAAATERRVVRMVYESEAGVVQTDDRITDWFAQDGAEYLS